MDENYNFRDALQQVIIRDYYEWLKEAGAASTQGSTWSTASTQGSTTASTLRLGPTSRIATYNEQHRLWLSRMDDHGICNMTDGEFETWIAFMRKARSQRRAWDEAHASSTESAPSPKRLRNSSMS